MCVCIYCAVEVLRSAPPTRASVDIRHQGLRRLSAQCSTISCSRVIEVSRLVLANACHSCPHGFDELRHSICLIQCVASQIHRYLFCFIAEACKTSRTKFAQSLGLCPFVPLIFEALARCVDFEDPSFESAGCLLLSHESHWLRWDQMSALPTP